MANLYDVAKKYVGQSIDVDGFPPGQPYQCLSGEYLIKLFNKQQVKLSDIRTGDLLSTGNIVYQNEPFTSNYLWLRTKQGYFKVTPKHKVFTDKGVVEVENLTTEHNIALDLTEAEEKYKDISPDDLRLFGLWLGDGSINYRWKTSATPTIRFTLGVERKYEYIEKLCPLGIRYQQHSNGKARVYSLINKNHPKLWRLIKDFPDKKLKDVFTKEQYAYIIEGYEQADGYIDNSSCVISSTTKELLVTIQHGYHLNGWSAILGKKQVRKETNLCKNPKPLWVLRTNKNKKPLNHFVSLTEGGVETFYRLNVTGDHSYVADNQIHHNCVDIINKASADMGKPRLLGNAIELHKTPGLSQHADIIPYNLASLRKGDIVLGPAGNPYGHVIIYGSGPSTNTTLIDQNFLGPKVSEHSYNLETNLSPTHIIRWKGQTEGDSVSRLQDGERSVTYGLYEIVADEVTAVDSSGNKITKLFSCNKVTGVVKGDKLEYHRADGSVGYIPLSAVKGIGASSVDKPIEFYNKPTVVDPAVKFDDTVIPVTPRMWEVADFIKAGAIDFGAHRWTYDFRPNLPLGGSDVDGLSVNLKGFVIDKDGYIVLNMSPKYGNTIDSVMSTPFGTQGKVHYNFGDQDGVVVYIK